MLATLSVFAGMLLAYKTGLIKVTEKFRRIVTMAVIGYAIFALINLGYALITDRVRHRWDRPPRIGISIFAIGLASAMLALDFDSIDRAIAAGAPENLVAARARPDRHPRLALPRDPASARASAQQLA